MRQVKLYLTSWKTYYFANNGNGNVFKSVVTSSLYSKSHTRCFHWGKLRVSKLTPILRGLIPFPQANLISVQSGEIKEPAVSYCVHTHKDFPVLAHLRSQVIKGTVLQDLLLIFFTFNARKRLYFISVSSCVSSAEQ